MFICSPFKAHLEVQLVSCTEQMQSEFHYCHMRGLLPSPQNVGRVKYGPEVFLTRATMLGIGQGRAAGQGLPRTGAMGQQLLASANCPEKRSHKLWGEL